MTVPVEEFDGIDVTSEMVYLQSDKIPSEANLIAVAQSMVDRIAEFKPLPEKLDLGAKDSAIWFSYVLKNNDSSDRRIFIEMPRQYFWIARLFLLADHDIKQVAVTGLEVDKSAELVHTTESMFTVRVPEEASVRLLFYAETDGPVDLQTRIFSSEPYLNHAFRSHNLNGIFFGILICLIIYNLYNYLNFRDRSYLYFIGALFGVTMLFSTINGVGVDVLWPTAAGWNRDLLHFFAGFYVFFSLKTLLVSVDQPLPRFDRQLATLGNWISIGLIFLPISLAHFIPNTKGVAINITLIGNVIVMVIVPVIAIRSWSRGFRPAVLMALAFAPYGVSTLMRTLAQFGIGYEIFLENQPHQLAAALAMIMTSMSLADRMAYVRQKQLKEADSIRERNAALIEQQKILSKEQEATIRVAQMLAHDVRKPFSIVRIGLDLISRSRNFDEVRQYLSKLQPEVEAASGTVDALIRDVMDMGADTSNSGRAPNAIEPLIKDTLAQAFLLFPRATIAIDYDLRHSTMLYVDRDKILRVFSNIYINAIQAIGNSGNTWFKSQDVMIDGTPFVQLCIGNSGSYIPESNLTRIFDAFFTTGKRNGTGLGLAVARKIVTECGGQICCDSLKSEEFPNGKVEFYLTLPVAIGHPEILGRKLPNSSAGVYSEISSVKAEHDSRDEVDPRRGYLETQLSQATRLIQRSLRILIIDDDVSYRLALRSYLEQPSKLKSILSISDADSSDSAFRLIEKLEFDLVICDIELGFGSLSGFEIVKKMKSLCPSAMFCLHSNRIVQADHKLAVQVGADSYLPKPMSRGQLLRLALQASEGVAKKADSLDKDDLNSASYSRPVPTVVVVDDSPFVLEAWAAHLSPQVNLHLLSDFDSLMHQVNSQPEFLHGLKCLIVDMYIDGSAQNGLEIGRIIKKMRPDLTVLLSSDSIVSESELKGAADRVIGKEPQSLDRLGLSP